MDVHIAGGVLYAAAGWEGLHLFSVAEPGRLAALGHWTASDWVIDVGTDGTTAYVTLGRSGVAAVDVTDPAAPRLLGSVAVPGFAGPVDGAGGIAYVGWFGSSGALGGVAIADMTEPATPVLIASIGRFAALTHLELAGDHLYVSDEGEGLVVYQVTPA